MFISNFEPPRAVNHHPEVLSPRSTAFNSVSSRNCLRDLADWSAAPFLLPPKDPIFISQVKKKSPKSRSPFLSRRPTSARSSHTGSPTSRRLPAEPKSALLNFAGPFRNGQRLDLTVAVRRVSVTCVKRRQNPSFLNPNSQDLDKLPR